MIRFAFVRRVEPERVDLFSGESVRLSGDCDLCRANCGRVKDSVKLEAVSDWKIPFSATLLIIVNFNCYFYVPFLHVQEW